MRARLFPQNHPTPIVLDAYPAFLGVGENTEIQVSESPSSTRRCQIQLENGILVVIDLNSEEGTWVNGESIERAPLMPGDKLSIGEVSLIVSYERLTRSTPPDVLYRTREPLGVTADDS